MNTFCDFFVFIAIWLSLCVSHTEGKQFASKSSRRCIPDLTVIWSREVSTSPYASPPVITDVDGDGTLDVIAVSHSGDVSAVRANNGRDIKGAHWPYRIPHTSVLASPLQYDVNKDGFLDVLIVSAKGEMLFLSKDGTLLEDKQFQIEDIYIQKDWYQKEVTADQGSVHDFILDTAPSSTEENVYVQVDPHVLATPIIADLNADGIVEEMVIPVSYFYDSDEYSNTLPSNVGEEELPLYLASALVLFNLTSMQPFNTIHLELTKISSEYPGYILFSPTVVDLHGENGDLEIILGTSAGHIHAIDSRTGKSLDNFPLPTDTIFGQVTVEDVNLDGNLELVAQDISGNVLCYSISGEIIWETQVTGSRPSGSRILDLDLDNKLEIILATEEGQVYVLAGETGEVLKNWPFQVADGLHAPPLIMPVLQQNIPAITLLGDDGFLDIISGDRNTCRDTVNVAETSLVPILSHDMVQEAPGIEMLISTKDGTLMCIGSGVNNTAYGAGERLMRDAQMYAWPSENKGANGFSYHGNRQGLKLLSSRTGVVEYTGSTFPLSITYVDNISPSRHKGFQLRVYLGSLLLWQEHFLRPDTYHLSLPTPSSPMEGHLVVEAVTRHGKVYRQLAAIRFHMTALQDLCWLLFGPAIGMGLILLFLHGYPAADILPISFTRKDR